MSAANPNDQQLAARADNRWASPGLRRGQPNLLLRQPQPLRLDDRLRLDLHQHLRHRETRHPDQRAGGQRRLEELEPFVDRREIRLHVGGVSRGPRDIGEGRPDRFQRNLYRGADLADLAASAMAGPFPLYGTCVILIFATMLKSSAAICDDDPVLAEA